MSKQLTLFRTTMKETKRAGYLIYKDPISKYEKSIVLQRKVLFDRLKKNSESFMHLSMLSPRVGGGGVYLWEIDSESLPLGRDFDTYALPHGREFDMSAILEHGENLEMSYPQPPF